jgi:hypothetical protein
MRFKGGRGSIANNLYAMSQLTLKKYFKSVNANKPPAGKLIGPGDASANQEPPL